MIYGLEVLPLVEFYLEEDISDEEAVSLIDLEVPRVERNGSWQEMGAGGNISYTFIRRAEEPKKSFRETRDSIAPIYDGHWLLCNELPNDVFSLIDKWIKNSNCLLHPCLALHVLLLPISQILIDDTCNLERYNLSTNPSSL